MWIPVRRVINQRRRTVLYMTLVRDAHISVSGRKGTAFATLLRAETLVVLPLYTLYLYFSDLSTFYISYLHFKIDLVKGLIQDLQDGDRLRHGLDVSTGYGLYSKGFRGYDDIPPSHPDLYPPYFCL